jgi:hypothetical protein
VPKSTTKNEVQPVLPPPLTETAAKYRSSDSRSTPHTFASVITCKLELHMSYRVTLHWSSNTTIFKILILVIVSTMVIAAKYAMAFLMVPTNWSITGPHG